MVRSRLTRLIQTTVENLAAHGTLPPALVQIKAEVEPPKDPAHGDFATNFALVAAKTAGQNPRALAETLAEALRNHPQIIESVQIAGPGFINLTLNPTWVAKVVEDINANPDFYRPAPNSQTIDCATNEAQANDGEANDGPKGQRINVEFVSVNPNGPITIGSGRGAAFGSALCNVLEAAGNTVHREYYINDGVNSEQMRLFAESVREYALTQLGKVFDQTKISYKGDYVEQLSKRIARNTRKPRKTILVHALRKTVEDFLSDQHVPGSPRVFLPLYFYNVISMPKNEWPELSREMINKFESRSNHDSLFAMYWSRLNQEFDEFLEFSKLNEHPLVFHESESFPVKDLELPDKLTLGFIRKNVWTLFAVLDILEFRLDRSRSALRMGVLMHEVCYQLAIAGSHYLAVYNNINEDEVDDFVQSTGAYFYMYVRNEIKKHFYSTQMSVEFASRYRKEVDASSFSTKIDNASSRVSESLIRLIGSQLGKKPVSFFQTLSQDMMIERQQSDLVAFGVNFDTWFSEQSLHDSGQVQEVLDHLVKIGSADTNPHRTKLLLGKGGILKDVQIESQPTVADDEESSSEASSSEAGSSEAGSSEANSPTLWLRSTKFGDDQDRVLRRADGRLTYIASDVAYHKDKFNRPADADKLITILGPDHHGYIGRLQAVVAAMILDDPEVKELVATKSSSTEGSSIPEQPLSDLEAKIYATPAERDLCQAALAVAKKRLEVQIFQIVRFLKDGKPAPMRKRDGNIYALIDLINEIGETLKPDGTPEEKRQAGSDVARFFYLMRHHDTAMDFDLELATKQSDENPVFYVQYAHARICSILEKAKPLPLPKEGEGVGDGGSPTERPQVEGEVAPSRAEREESNETPEAKAENHDSPNLHLLTHPREKALILKLADLPHEIARTAEDYAVNRLTTYATELARTYHHFYDACRVIQPDQPELTQARLALCQATQKTLAQTLNLLGISAPERM